MLECVDVYNMPTTTEARILELARLSGVIRPRDLVAQGLRPGAALQRLVRRGQLRRYGRGLYELPDAAFTEHHSLVEVAQRVPHGVVCLLSALQFHRLGTQWPHEIWIAIDRKARRPQLESPRLRVSRFSGEALRADVETHVLEGVPVHIYGAAKTVADCFKYRHKIGLDVAIEALHDYIRKRSDTLDALWRAAQACRVANVIRPYIEASL